MHMLTRQRARCAQWRHLCHAPGMHHVDAILITEGFHHRGWARRATNDGAFKGRKFQIVLADMRQ